METGMSLKETKQALCRNPRNVQAGTRGKKKVSLPVGVVNNESIVARSMLGSARTGENPGGQGDLR